MNVPSYFNIQNSFSFSIYYRMKRWNTSWQTLKYPADFKRSTWCLGENSSRSHEREHGIGCVEDNTVTSLYVPQVYDNTTTSICYLLQDEDILPRKKLYFEKNFLSIFRFYIFVLTFLINISRGKFWRIYFKATNIGSR